MVCALTALSIYSSNAHGQLISSFPEQYSNTVPIPRQVWLEFDGELQTLDDQVINTLEVIDSTGLTVSYGELIIEGGKMSTQLSGQSAPGVFTVNYRIVSKDAHLVEGSYNFNASPNYSAKKPVKEVKPKEDTSVPVEGLVAIVFLVVFVFGIILKRNSKKG